MTIVGILSIVLPLIVAVIVASIIVYKKKRPLKKEYFVKHWRELQKLCSNKDTWPLAIINADKLLDEALKKANYKGKTIGERLVSAQHSLSNNEDIWMAHKLRNRLVHENDITLREQDVKNALLKFRDALKDIGAI